MALPPINQQTSQRTRIQPRRVANPGRFIDVASAGSGFGTLATAFGNFANKLSKEEAEEAEKRFGLDQERLDTQKELSEERNDIQVDIAEMKDQTAQDRLKLQQAVQMGNLAEKMTKNFFGN